MFAVLRSARKSLSRVAIIAGAVALTACQPVAIGGGGPQINTRAPVPVALLVPGGSSLPGVGQGWADGPLAAPVTLASGLALDIGGLALLLGAWSRMSSLYPLASSRTQAVDDGHPADIVGLTAEDQEALKGAGDDASRRKRARRHRLSFLRGGRGRRAKRASQLLLAMQQRELLRQLQEEGDLDEEKGMGRSSGGGRTGGDGSRYDASEEDRGEQDSDQAGVVVARRAFGGGGEVQA